MTLYTDKRVNHQEGIKIITMYATNKGAPNYKNWILMESKVKIDSSTLTGGNFNTLLSIMDRTSREEINMEIENLNNTISQPDLLDKYKTPVNNNGISSLLSTQGILSRNEHILDHKKNVKAL